MTFRDTTSYYQPHLSRELREKLIAYHGVNVKIAMWNDERKFADECDRRITELRRNAPISLTREECDHIGLPTNYAEAAA